MEAEDNVGNRMCRIEPRNSAVLVDGATVWGRLETQYLCGCSGKKTPSGSLDGFEALLENDVFSLTISQYL